MESVRGLRRGVVVLAIAVFLVGWIVVLPRAAATAKGGLVTYDSTANKYTISPTATDDTENIQAAFDGCAADGSRCTVQLTNGTFYTAQIIVRNFQGKFLGMGQGVTTIQALPNLPVTNDRPFNLHLPSASNPWPNLFTFFDGTYSISDVTFIEPFAVPMRATYRGMDFPGKVDLLYSFVSITGLHANVAVDHVTMLGAPGDFNFFGGPVLFNVMQGIFPQALLMEHGGGKLPRVIPFQVTLRATDTVFYRIDSPFVGENLVNSTYAVSRSTFDTGEWAVIPIYISQTVVTVSQNLARNIVGGAAVQAYNDYFVTPNSALAPCQSPSQVLVSDNDFQVTATADAVAFLDGAYLSGCAPSLTATVTDNIFRSDATSFEAVYSTFLKSLAVSGNEILGATPKGVYLVGGPAVVSGNEIEDSAVGVMLDSAAGVLVRGNKITNSEQWGIALVNGSSNNAIVGNVVKNSGLFDLYWDGTGSGNVWKGNVCLTSSPPGLCSGS